MFVLNAHGTESIIALIPKGLDVAATEHVAIHKNRPTLESHQVGHKKSCERKRSALLRISGTSIEAQFLQLGSDEGRDRQRHAAQLIEAVDQHVGCRPLARVVSDKDRDRLADARH